MGEKVKTIRAKDGTLCFDFRTGMPNVCFCGLVLSGRRTIIDYPGGVPVKIHTKVSSDNI